MDVAKVRAQLAAQSANNTDQISLDAFDTFFGSGMPELTQDEFSRLMRDHSLRLVGSAF